MESKSFHFKKRPNEPNQWQRSRERREEWWQNDATPDAAHKITPHAPLARNNADYRALRARSSAAVSRPGLAAVMTGWILHPMLLLVRRIRRAFRQYLENRRTYLQLLSMNDRELQDMGLNRCDIDSVMDGSLPHDPTRVRSQIRRRMK